MPSKLTYYQLILNRFLPYEDEVSAIYVQYQSIFRLRQIFILKRGNAVIFIYYVILSNMNKNILIWDG